MKRAGMWLSIAVASGLAVGADDARPAVAAAPKLEVKEEELARVPVVPTGDFAWKKAGTPKKVTPQKSADDAPDLSSGEVIIKAMGELTREEQPGRNAAGKAITREVLTLNRAVEIEQLESQSVLRGATVKVMRNIETGNTELLEARGKVELISPDRRGIGEFLSAETLYGDHNEIVKNITIIEGEAGGAKAVIWQGDDVIEAGRFVIDRRMNTFRITGQPAAVITLPQDQGAPPVSAKPVPKKAESTGMLPGFSTMGGGGKVRLQCDGEMLFDGSSGSMRLARNVLIQQQSQPGQGGVKLLSDEAVLTLTLPPPGQPSEANGVFSGSLREMTCIGRVEIHTDAQVILCDKATLNMEKHFFTMEMSDPKQDVRVFMKEFADGGTVMISPARLSVNLNTNEFQGGGPLRRKPYSGAPESLRAKLEGKP